jgi:hypothetical protein
LTNDFVFLWHAPFFTDTSDFTDRKLAYSASFSKVEDFIHIKKETRKVAVPKFVQRYLFLGLFRGKTSPLEKAGQIIFSEDFSSSDHISRLARQDTNGMRISYL